MISGVNNKVLSQLLEIKFKIKKMCALNKKSVLKLQMFSHYMFFLRKKKKIALEIPTMLKCLIGVAIQMQRRSQR